MSGILGGLFRLTVGRRNRTLADLPGPPPRFPAGNAARFLSRQPWEVCAELGKQYGPMFVIWIFNRPFVVLNDGWLVREVLDTRADEFYKADPVPAFRPLTPRDSLFLANGDEWKRLREHDPYNRVDHRRFLADQIPAVRRLVRQRTTDLIDATAVRPVDLTRTLQRITFDAFALCVWGQLLEERTYEDFNIMGDVGACRVAFPPLTILPPLRPSFYAARRRWETTFAALIERARAADPAGHHDLLHATLPKIEPASLDAYRVAMATMFYGGVYSVTSGVVSTLYSLESRPDFARRVYDELRAATYGPKGFDQESLENCRQLDAALRETLRLLSPVPVFLRNVNQTQPVTLGGYTLPPDTPIIISSWLLHRSSRVWENAETYQPERWLNGAAEAHPLGSDHFFPFGRGPRTCIGQSLGMFAMKLLLATLLSEAKVKVTGNYRQSFYFGVMMPRGLQAELMRD
ncbi:MAG: cytochrome P450 [Pirellulaceae bacterium]|nr:cytochrome P450 [Pirellulaceae bacterium]